MNRSGQNSGNKFFVQSIGRAFAVLDEVGKANEYGLSLSDIAEKVGVPVSTVFRIVQTLLAWRYLVENENGNYVLGFSFLTMANIVRRNIVLTKYTRKYMEELNRHTKETILLAVLDKLSGGIIYIDKIETHRNIKLACEVGTQGYIHSTANGKCLVSTTSADRIRELLAIRGLPPCTPHTITDVDQFLAAVQKVREDGYAIDDLENEPGVRCVAAPIFDYTGNAIAAISISGVEANMPLDILHDDYSHLVKQATLGISRQMGYSG
jgi:IclR family KDG regulon transcriptional repressor